MESKRFRTVLDPRPIAVIITCIDPRFEEAFGEFPIQVLGLKKGQFIHMKIGGGPTPLAYPAEMPSRCKYLAKQLQFTCSKFPITRVIPVSHQDCAYYTQFPCTCQGPEREKNDLPRAGGFMELWLPNQKIEPYHARFTSSKEEIIFEAVAISPQEKAVIELEWTKKSYQQATH